MQEAVRGTKAYDFAGAARAMQALLADPNDVEQVFRIINALPGHSVERVAQRLRRTPTGARLLHEQRALCDVLRDRSRLAALPADSLGAAYLRFMDDEKISADGLVAADDAAGRSANIKEGELDFVWRYLRDTHDLWHVVTGYHGDLLGEPALQAFNFAQNWHPGVGIIALAVFLKGGFLTGVRRLILGGFYRGLRAKPLIEEDWESLLPMPLEKVRQLVRVPALRPYQPIRLSDLPGGKLPG